MDFLRPTTSANNNSTDNKRQARENAKATTTTTTGGVALVVVEGEPQPLAAHRSDSFEYDSRRRGWYDISERSNVSHRSRQARQRMRSDVERPSNLLAKVAGISICILALRCATLVGVLGARPDTVTSLATLSTDVLSADSESQQHQHYHHHHHHHQHHHKRREIEAATSADAKDDRSRENADDERSRSAIVARQQPTTRHCTAENEICSTNNAQICRNNSCVSACSLKDMRECACASEEENYCYLCCGNADNKCLPAHQHQILRNNGERWERESCARCRMNGAEMEGLACDDRDPQRLCLQGKCSRSVCHDKAQGAYCDRKMEKVCVDDVCENPCAKIAPHLMVCDCPPIDPDTGFASDDRCQLCCYDFNIKPASRRCQSAFRKYRVANAQSRPIWRVGLECAGGKRCNRYGVCSTTNDAQRLTTAGHGVAIPLALFLIFLVVVVALAAVFTTSETF